jgi:hypothetical protein
METVHDNLLLLLVIRKERKNEIEIIDKLMNI